MSLTHSDAIVAARSKEHVEELLGGPLPVLLDFTATWCGPCKQMAPALDAFAEDTAGWLRVVAVDVDELKPVAKRFSVSAMPTLLLVDGGVPQIRVTAGLDKQQLHGWFGDYARLAPPSAGATPRRGWVDRPARVLDFPDGERQAKLYLYDADGRRVHQGDTMDRPAVGRVEFDAGVYVGLDVGGQDADLSLLDGLAPHAIDALHVSVMRSFPDAEFERILRLDGLLNLSIVGARPSDAALLRLAEMPALARLDVRALDGRGYSTALREQLQRRMPWTVVDRVWLAPDLQERRLAAGLTPLATGLGADSSETKAGLHLQHRDGQILGTIQLAVPDAWHVFGRSRENGIPLSVDVVSPDVEMMEIRVPEGSEGALSGIVSIPVVLRGDADEVSLRVTIQECNDTVCRPPRTLDLATTVVEPH